ncbi:MAG: hypothetical protein LZF61_07655 [Nitrosomonas sp.]|nr:MAG: hypothetical protein LZF61_07655 [Nitrosomonas sp.]
MKITIKPSGLLAGAILVVALIGPAIAEAGRDHHRHGRHYHGHHHSGGYIYSQPQIYYRQYYPHPRYNYVYPVPAYRVPSPAMMGIDTGNFSFMIGF